MGNRWLKGHTAPVAYSTRDLISRRPVAQMAFLPYLAKNAIAWWVMSVDIIGVVSDDISRSQKNWFG